MTDGKVPKALPANDFKRGCIKFWRGAQSIPMAAKMQWVGVASIVGGVTVLIGGGWALIVAGTYLTVFSLTVTR